MPFFSQHHMVRSKAGDCIHCLDNQRNAWRCSDWLLSTACSCGRKGWALPVNQSAVIPESCEFKPLSKPLESPLPASNALPLRPRAFPAGGRRRGRGVWHFVPRLGAGDRLQVSNAFSATLWCRGKCGNTCLNGNSTFLADFRPPHILWNQLIEIFWGDWTITRTMPHSVHARVRPGAQFVVWLSPHDFHWWH